MVQPWRRLQLRPEPPQCVSVAIADPDLLYNCRLRLLPRPINHTLAATPDFFEQLVVAKFCPDWRKCFASALSSTSSPARTEDRLQQAGIGNFPSEEFLLLPQAL